MFKKMSPNLMVKDVRETVEFYTNILGFEMVMAVPESQDNILTRIDPQDNVIYALVKKDEVEIMFQKEESIKEDIPVFSGYSIGASVSFYMSISDIQSVYEGLRTKVNVVKELGTTWYGVREFYILDNNGYVLGFSEEA